VTNVTTSLSQQKWLEGCPGSGKPSEGQVQEERVRCPSKGAAEQDRGSGCTLSKGSQCWRTPVPTGSGHGAQGHFCGDGGREMGTEERWGAGRSVARVPAPETREQEVKAQGLRGTPGLGNGMNGQYGDRNLVPHSVSPSSSLPLGLHPPHSLPRTLCPGGVHGGPRERLRL
jgi:hypothetical protein